MPPPTAQLAKAAPKPRPVSPHQGAEAAPPSIPAAGRSPVPALGSQQGQPGQRLRRASVLPASWSPAHRGRRQPARPLPRHTHSSWGPALGRGEHCHPLLHQGSEEVTLQPSTPGPGDQSLGGGSEASRAGPGTSSVFPAGPGAAALPLGWASLCPRGSSQRLFIYLFKVRILELLECEWLLQSVLRTNLSSQPPARGHPRLLPSLLLPRAK